jgi:hypothetical protein
MPPAKAPAESNVKATLPEPAIMPSDKSDDPVPMAIGGEQVEEPETPLSEIDEPVLAVPRPMPRIKLKMPKKEVEEGMDTAIETLNVDEVSPVDQDMKIESPPAVAANTRPRRTASQQAPTPAARPIRSNKRARAAKPEPAAPVTRALRSRRGDRTEEDLQKEREKAEAIRAALESGEDDEDEDGIEGSL